MNNNYDKKNHNEENQTKFFFTVLYINTIFPIINEIKKRRKRGYLIFSKKATYQLKELAEYFLLFGFIAILVFITFKFIRK